eukprot:TRINITY_DN757_c1_g2_i1.p2 TRINITY_DN757_c1_g2~~TRINITY_DN757_c1_g2_i1.p2  ORF type:complete len:229 (+),score=81.25 TRINITY_DN757_c1_g2_i1:72-689(+)
MSHAGKVKSWSDHKGFGFIIPDAGGDDVFVHRRALGMHCVLIPDKPVTYEFVMEKGKPKATSVEGEGLVRGGGNGFQRGGAGGAGAYQMPQGMQQMGVVKTWLPDKGYGFISQGPGGNGEDLFVMTSNTVPMQAVPTPGDKVTFTVGVNPKNGKPWAENVAVLPAFDAAAAAMYGGYNPHAALAAQYWQAPAPYPFQFPGYYPTA